VAGISSTFRQDLVQMISKAFIEHLDLIKPRFLTDLHICSEMGTRVLCAAILGPVTEGEDTSIVACACLKQWDRSKLHKPRNDIVSAVQEHPVRC
jgi:hypothetical protein